MAVIETVVTNETEKLLEKGLATLTKGGVRDVNTGKIIELFQPVQQNPLKSAAQNLVSGSVISTASSLAANVQLGVLQQSVNVINQKMDVLSKSVGLVQKLSVLNSALSLVNCAVTVAGFKKVLSNINDLQTSICNLEQTIKQQKLNEDINKYNQYVMNLFTICNEMQYSSIENSSYAVSFKIEEISVFINNLIDQFIGETIPEEFVCNAILNLTVSFVQAVREYTLHYYYQNGGRYPEEYTCGIWFNFISKINDPDFRSRLRKFVNMKTFPCSLNQTRDIVDLYCGMIDTKTYETITICSHIIPEISYDDYKAKVLNNPMEIYQKLE